MNQNGNTTNGELGVAPAGDDFQTTFSVTSINPNGLHVVSAVADNLASPPGMSKITLTFNIAVDPTTCSASDVNLVGPGGTVVVNPPTSDASGAVWTITFASGAQTATGTYALTLSNTLIASSAR